MTTRDGAGIHGGRPWLVSRVMWTNYLRHIDASDTPTKELSIRSGDSASTVKSRLHHLEWWTYLTVEAGKASLTRAGRQACDEWGSVERLVDERWRSRLGKGEADRLAAPLALILEQAPGSLPDSMPVVDYSKGMRVAIQVTGDTEPAQVDRLTLGALLARVLLAFTLEFERRHDVSLTISANVLRVLLGEGVPLRELPLKAGIAKEGTTAAVNHVKKSGLISVGAEKSKSVGLTAKGRKAAERHRAIL